MTHVRAPWSIASNATTLVRAERLRDPVPGEADVLWRIERHDTADGLRVSQRRPQLPADSRVQGCRVEPQAQAVGRGEQRKDEMPRRIDLGLELDTIVHSPGPCDLVASGRNRNHAQNATEAMPNTTSSATSVKNDVRVVSAR